MLHMKSCGIGNEEKTDKVMEHILFITLQKWICQGILLEKQ